MNFFKLRNVNEGKTKVNMRRPSLEGRIVFGPQCLNLLILHFKSECQGSVMDQFFPPFHLALASVNEYCVIFLYMIYI